MATIGFLQIDGIDGDSSDSNHDRWIDVLSYKHHIQMPVAQHGANVALAVRMVQHNPIEFTKSLDSSSPKLALYLCKGNNISSVKFELIRQIGGEKMIYMEYELSDAKVVNLNTGGVDVTSAGLPTETVSFSYSIIKWKYTNFDPATGQRKGDVPAGWNVVSGQEVS